MSIATKSGDKGQTSLWSGERISKDDVRVEAYGTLDELNSHLGEVKHLVDEGTRAIIVDIQYKLVRIMGELACRGKVFHEPIGELETDHLTSIVMRYEQDIKLEGFVIPGKTINGARIDICRTVCRRAERRIISLSKCEDVSVHILCFMNRLSDLLFLIGMR